jgi:PIN domain nuclease of toxin-antitoxin system
MHPALLLDTHTWVWWLLGPAGGSKLSTREANALDALPLDQRPALCDISLWEVAMLVDLGRLHLDSPLADWLDSACSAVQVLPISKEVATEVATLPSSLHRDPADRIIIATARVHRLPLLSRDTKISRTGLVAIWTTLLPQGT